MKISTGIEPRFDIDLDYGQAGEREIQQLLGWVAEGGAQLEVKRKRILDLWFYIETHCDKGRRGEFRPSGILVTTAHVWAFVLADSGISLMVPTQLLRSMLDDPSTRDKQETDGSCPTRGKLIYLPILLQRLREQPASPPPSTPPTDSRVVPAEVETTSASTITADDINWGFSDPAPARRKVS